MCRFTVTVINISLIVFTKNRKDNQIMNKGALRSKKAGGMLFDFTIHWGIIKN